MLGSRLHKNAMVCSRRNKLSIQIWVHTISCKGQRAESGRDFFQTGQWHATDTNTESPSAGNHITVDLMSESIYSWIKEDPRAPPKAERYKSTFDPTTPLTGSTISAPKKAAGTFGRSVKDTVRPDTFLKTREGKTGASLPERKIH